MPRLQGKPGKSGLIYIIQELEVKNQVTEKIVGTSESQILQ